MEVKDTLFNAYHKTTPEFDILEIKDGVQLYRNPVQTMDKIKSLIPGLKNMRNIMLDLILLLIIVL